MTKQEAVNLLLADAHRGAVGHRASTASAKRIMAACKALGLDSPIETLVWLDYCNSGGAPHSGFVKRIW